jgi:hypothetical protein
MAMIEAGERAAEKALPQIRKWLTAGVVETLPRSA